MYKTVLVSLDGSESAEAALSYAEELGWRLGSELILVSVSEPEYPVRHLLEVYLNEQVNRLAKQGIKARYEVVRGEPASQILNYSVENKVSLIVLSRHGRTMIARWGLGGIAEKILRGADVPVLAVPTQPSPKLQKKATLKKALLALDGSALGEVCVNYVKELASKLNIEVILLHILLPYPERDMIAEAKNRALARREMRKYLSGVEKAFRNENISVRSSVRSGSAATEILDYSRRTKVDIIAMSTHGRTGLGQWAFGSVAGKVLRASLIPVLLVRATGAVVTEGRLVGEQVKQCHNCGALIRQEVFSSEDHCYRCGYYLRSRANCFFYNGFRCIMQRPEVIDIYAGNRCPVFQFRKDLWCYAKDKEGKLWVK